MDIDYDLNLTEQTLPNGDKDMMTATASFKNSLETAPNAGSPDSKAHTEPNHSNPYNTEQQLTTLTGGLPIEDKIEVVDGKKFDSHFDTIAVICFRWQLARLADDLVHLFSLPKPNGETCLMWRYHDWKFSAGAMFQPFGERYGAVWGRFLRSSCELRPTKGQGPRFYRFLQYMTAAVVEADLGVHATEALVDKLAQYIIAEKKKLQDQGFQNKETHHRGRDWIKSAGTLVEALIVP
ncbi:hypothetical protein K4K55_003437 [Colletotrichum sp. SAR 10_96]|nr:hypothetical protein K4K55_003437 [Colletotrichum sp. SAR 10_96]